MARVPFQMAAIVPGRDAIGQRRPFSPRDTWFVAVEDHHPLRTNRGRPPAVPDCT